MKIAVVSDLHLEFQKRGYKKPGQYFVPKFEKESVLVLAGDIQVGLNMDDWFVDLLAERHVVYVLGNHEFYGHDYTIIKESLPAFERRVNDKAKEKGYHFELHCLENKTATINGTRFIGATLWTDFNNGDPICMWDAARSMNDYRTVSNGDVQLSPEHILEVHKQSAAFIEEELLRNITSGYRTVVVTHHAPSYQSVALRYRTGHSAKSNPFYYTNLEHLVPLANVWFHGHVHNSFDYEVEHEGKKGRVVCNPFGYYGYEENNEFKPTVISI